MVACGSKTQNQNESSDSLAVPVEVVKEITDENLKQSKQELVQKMANDLYLEAEKEIEAAPAVEMDQRGIYDDIEAVDVIVEVAPALPTLDLGIVLEEETVLENKKEN